MCKIYVCEECKKFDDDCKKFDKSSYKYSNWYIYKFDEFQKWGVLHGYYAPLKTRSPGSIVKINYWMYEFGEEEGWYCPWGHELCV